MSSVDDSRPKPSASPSDSSASHALAQVEKWMAIIREVSRERRGEAVLRG
jgi:hypothetical protein